MGSGYLDVFTMFIFIGIMNIVLIFILTYYVIATKNKGWFVTTFIVAMVMETLAMLGIGLRNELPSLISIQLSAILYPLSICLKVISILSFKGKLLKRNIFAISIIVVVTIIIFLIFHNSERNRSLYGTLGLATIYLYATIALLKERGTLKLPVIIGVGFIIYIVVIIFRAINLILAETYNFRELIYWDILLLVVFMATPLCISFGFVLLLNELSQRNLYKQNYLKTLAFEQSPVTILYTDIDGSILYVNPFFEKVTGYSKEEVIGKNPKILNSGQTPVEIFDDLWKTLASGNIWKGNFINQKKNKEIYYEEAVIAPIVNFDKKTEGYVAFKQDITERINNERLIESRNKELMDLNKTKDKFFSIISHDLRGPFHGLIALTEILMENPDRLPNEKKTKLLTSIYESGKQMYSLLENLLTWARSQTGKIEPKPEVFPLIVLIKQNLYLLKEQIKNKEISAKVDVNENLPVYADMNMIDTVIRNLLSNAIKFTNPKGVIQFRAKLEESHVVFEIEDNGVGMPPDKLGKLFRIDTKVSTVGTQKESGTGLGLILCKDFIEQNKGKIEVESKVDLGSTFRVILPAK
ncbi:MAG: ATP-binding protein [Bacteroidales bacterium]|nr:ATP-binding protein [Bacteroidales bacterium]